MIVSVVAVAGVGLLEARVLELWLRKFITSVGWKHECIDEKVPIEWWQLSLTIPSVQRQHRRIVLFLDRWHIIVNL